MRTSQIHPLTRAARRLGAAIGAEMARAMPAPAPEPGSRVLYAEYRRRLDTAETRLRQVDSRAGTLVAVVSAGVIALLQNVFSLTALDRIIGGVALALVAAAVVLVGFGRRWSTYMVEPPDPPVATAVEAEELTLPFLKVGVLRQERRAEERERELGRAVLGVLAAVLAVGVVVIAAANLGIRL